MKTINIKDITIHELNILPEQGKAVLVYSLLDDKNGELIKKRTTLELTTAQLEKAKKVIGLLETIIKKKEGL